MNDIILNLEHAYKSFGHKSVLNDVSLKIKKGQVVAIIGSSGGGKSTLLRCCTLLEKIDSGSLYYGNIEVAKDINGKSHYANKKILQEAHSRFGLVFQDFNLFPHYTVMKNIIDAPINVKHMEKDKAEKQALRLLEEMSLSDTENMVPCELSGGQKQRVAIARALAMKPDILMLDEPTSALDPEVTRDVLSVIKLLADFNMTMVIVTHEISFAFEVANHIIFMDEGKIVESGSPEKIFNNPKNERTQKFLSHMTDPF